MIDKRNRLDVKKMLRHSPTSKKNNRSCKNTVFTDSPILSGMTLAGSRLVVSSAHIQAYSSPPVAASRDTPEKLAHMLDPLVRVTQQQRWKNQTQKLCFFVCHWSGCGNTRFEVRGVMFDEMDTVPNLQVRRRTVMASGAQSVFNYGRPWLWAAALHGDKESHILRPWTSWT